MGKLTQKREQRIWIISIALCIVFLIVAITFYIPLLEHIMQENTPYPLDTEDAEAKHPYLYSVGEVRPKILTELLNTITPDLDIIIRFFDALDLTILTLLALLLIPARAYHSDRKWRDDIDDHIPSLLREISDAQKTGLPLPRAILEASKHQYGALTPELKRMASKITWGIPFSKSLRSLTDATDTPMMRRTALLILEAERSGGAIEDVFESAHKHVSEILGLKRERLGAMKPYRWIIFASFLVFAFVMLILLVTFFQTLAVQVIDAVTEGQEATAGLPFNVAGLQIVFFHMMVIEAVFAGLISGKMSEGDAKLGLRDSCILLVICYVLFKLTMLLFPIVVRG